MSTNMEQDSMIWRLEKFREMLPGKADDSEYANYWVITLMTQATKVLFKILEEQCLTWTKKKTSNEEAGSRNGSEAWDQDS